MASVYPDTIFPDSVSLLERHSLRKSLSPTTPSSSWICSEIDDCETPRTSAVRARLPSRVVTPKIAQMVIVKAFHKGTGVT